MQLLNSWYLCAVHNKDFLVGKITNRQKRYEPDQGFPFRQTDSARQKD